MTRVETAEAPPVTPLRFSHWRFDATVLAVVAVLLRLPAFFADRSLVFDDGVFASSALAMRAGEVPFRDIFSSQGPVFLPLLWVADLVGFRTMDAPRILSVAAGVLRHHRGLLVRTARSPRARTRCSRRASSPPAARSSG